MIILRFSFKNPQKNYLSYMTYRNVYDYYIKELTSLYDQQEAESISAWIFEDMLGLSKIQMVLRGQDTISEVKANDLAYILLRLLKGEPLQYILGYTYFHGLKIKVNRQVLIPRPETEELVAWIIKDYVQNQSCTFLDLGTGSGCIAIALKRNLPHAMVTAVDLNEQALLVALENAEIHQAAVNFLKLDLLHLDKKPEPFPPSSSAVYSGLSNTVDVIVSNPPYIPQAEAASIHRNVIGFEPPVALFVPDDEPLIYYDAIARLASQWLSPGGAVYLELHPDFASDVAALMNRYGFYSIRVNNDLQGKQRMLKAGR